jgi:hypothetical protein
MSAPRTRGRALLAYFALLVVSATITWPLLGRGWTPHDDGMLGQTAERIRAGQLPHRDFEEIYTGALGYYHALAQLLAGTTMMAPRYALFAMWLGWIGLVYVIAKRVAPVWWAAAFSLAVGMWTVPVYPAAMPSWYLLFLGTAAIGALFRWRDENNTRWIYAAGLAIGTALTIKITALYLLAAAMISIVVAEQDEPHPRDGNPVPVIHSAVSWMLIAGLLLLPALVFGLLRSRLAGGELVHLGLPTLLVVSAVILRELRTHDRRWPSIIAPLARLAIGIAIPVLIFTLPYVLSGSAMTLMRGVFLDPLTRIGGMNFQMSALNKTVPGLWVIALAAAELRWGGTRMARAAFACIASYLVWRSTISYKTYEDVWEGIRLLLPFAVGAVALTSGIRERFVAITLAAFTSLFALNQFPFSAHVYFCFVAPFAFLTLWFVVPGFAPRLVGTTVLLGGFALLALQPGDIKTLGYYPTHTDLSHRLATPRGGLLVSEADSALYADAIRIIAEHRGSLPIYAGPGTPELEFLAGPPYAGRGVFHFLGTDVRDTVDVSRLAPAAGANVVVWNLKPYFGEKPSPAVQAWYAARFPNSALVDAFEVRWR